MIRQNKHHTFTSLNNKTEMNKYKHMVTGAVISHSTFLALPSYERSNYTQISSSHSGDGDGDIVDFAVSAAIGAATDSAILGGLLGGSVMGGVVGDILDGDLFD